MSLTIVEYDSRTEKLTIYFTEKYNPAIETPQEYLKRMLSSKSPFNGCDKTPQAVKDEIWKRTTALINRKYQGKREEERLFWILQNASVPYTKKSGEQTKMTSSGIIMVPDLPTAYDLPTGKEVPFNQKRYLAGEITLSPPGVSSKAQKNISYSYFRFYSVSYHRFVSFETAKKAEGVMG
jgi:hypothetical protein